MSKVKKHFDEVAVTYDKGKKKYSYYYSNIKTLLNRFIPKNKKVLEIGCGTGDLLAFLKPKIGYGMDISSEMIRIARKKHKGHVFNTKLPNKKFDYIFMTDVIEHLEDPKKMFSEISKLMHKNSVFVNTMANPIWEPMLMFWEHRGWKMPEGPHNRISYQKLKTILVKSNMKIIKHDYFLLFPIFIPAITNFMNKYVERFFKKYAFIEYIVAKKR